MTEKNIIRRSLNELKNQPDRTRADAPEGAELGADFWDRAEIQEPLSKTPVNMRVDADILEFFKTQGKGHLTRMHAVLRSYVDAQRTK